MPPKDSVTTCLTAVVREGRFENSRRDTPYKCRIIPSRFQNTRPTLAILQGFSSLVSLPSRLAPEIPGSFALRHHKFFFEISKMLRRWAPSRPLVALAIVGAAGPNFSCAGLGDNTNPKRKRGMLLVLAYASGWYLFSFAIGGSTCYPGQARTTNMGFTPHVISRPG